MAFFRGQFLANFTIISKYAWIPSSLVSNNFLFTSYEIIKLCVLCTYLPNITEKSRSDSISAQRLLLYWHCSLLSFYRWLALYTSERVRCPISVDYSNQAKESDRYFIVSATGKFKYSRPDLLSLVREPSRS